MDEILAALAQHALTGFAMLGAGWMTWNLCELADAAVRLWADE